MDEGGKVSGIVGERVEGGGVKGGEGGRREGEKYREDSLINRRMDR